MRKKALSLLLAVSMVLSMFLSVPMTAAAVTLPGAVFSDGDLDRVYFSGDILTFNLSGLPVGTPPTGIPAGTALRVSLGIVDASGTFTDFTLFNTLSNGMGDGTGFYAERVLQADGTLASDISGAIVSTPTPTLGIVAVKLYVFNGSTWQNALQGQSPDYIPLSGADSKPATVGLDSVIELPDGVASDPVIGNGAQNAEDLRSMNISFTKTIATGITGKISFTDLNLMDNSSELAGLDDGLIMDQVASPAEGALAQFTMGIDSATIDYLASNGATVSVTSASFDGFSTDKFTAAAADAGGGAVSDLAFDDETDTVSFTVTHFSNYTLSVLENESELFYEDFESYAENTYPSSFTQQYNGTGDANQKVIATETFNGSTGKVFQLEGAPSWSSTQYVSLPSALPDNLVIDAYIKPVTTSRNAELALSNFGVGPWGTRISSVWFEGDGTIVAVQNGNDEDRISIGTYNVGQWYRVTLDNNMIAKTYDVYVDGILKASNIPMHSSVTPTALSIYAHNVTTSMAYYDNVGIYSELPDFYISNNDRSIIVANTNNSSIDFFDISANGDISPSRTIKGANTNLNRPVDLTVHDNELFVLNHELHAIEVFDSNSEGNTVPVRRITGGMAYPSGFDFDETSEEIFVANYSGNITVYNTSDNGVVTPKRTIDKGNTMTLVVSGNELFVTTYTEPVVYVYNKTTGAPLRTILGASTGFSSQLYGLAVIGADLYIADSANNSIKVFNTTDSGDAAPKRVISGSNTMLGAPRELHISGDKLYVANNNNTVTVYNLNSNGNVTPLQVISGPLTSFNAIQGVTTADVDAEPNYICAVVDTGTGTVLNEYVTLDLALAAVADGQTIKLLDDISYNDRIWAGSSYCPSLTLDLNGNELNISNVEVPIAAIDGYDIIVTDNSESGGGTLTIEDTLDDSAPTGVTAVGTGSSVLVDSSVTTNITATGNNSKGISAYYGGSVEICSGSITSDTYGIYAYGVSGDTSSLVTFTGNVSALSDYGIGVYTENGGSAVVTGDITGPNIGHGVIAYGGTIAITGNVTGSGYAATAYGSGLVTVTGNAASIDEYGCGAYAYDGGTVSIGGNVSASAINGYGAWAQNGGSITVGGNVSETGSGGVGAYADGYSFGGEITIEGTIEAENYICIGDRYLTPDETDEPTTKAGYLTYDYGDPVSTVWVKNHLLAVEDTWISEAYQGDINGANPTIETGITVDESSRAYGLLRFDVSSLPTSTEIVKLQLRFSGISSYGGHLSEVTVHKVTSAWDEDTVNYATRPTWDSSVIDTVDRTGVEGYPGDVWEWDITELYNQWKANPSSNFGVLLSAPASSVDLYASQGFYSKEGAPDDAFAPRLVIEESTCIAPDCTNPHADGVFTESEIINDETYYHISSPAQLAHINEHLDLNYIQTADIDLSQYNDGLWEPIGGYLGSDWFTGRYLGEGYKIENMELDLTSPDGSIIYAGLFGLTSPSAHIEGVNLEIDSMSAVQAPLAYGEVYLGGIAATHRSAGTIEDCHVTINGNVTATSDGGNVYVGGIVGYNIGNISGCSTTTSTGSTLTVAARGREAFVGGITGYTCGNIQNTDNSGKLHAEAAGDTYTRRVYVGGIAGYAEESASDTIIENCQNDADIESINNCAVENTYRAYAGGIVGHIDWNDSAQSVIIRNCANIGTDKRVYTKAPSTLTGGIAASARFVPQTNITIENCYNRSNVISVMLDFGYNKGPEYCTGVTAGGIVGAAGGMRLQYCYSDAADISATATAGEDAYEGGVAGLIWGTRLAQSYYETNENVPVGIDGAVDSSMAIVPQADITEQVEGASASQLKTKSFYGDNWQWYTSGGIAPDYYSSTDPWRFTSATGYPVLRGLLYTPTPPSGGGSYTPSTYKITATANAGGTITPAGNSSVTEYSNITFTIKPDKNYIIKDVLVDGTSVGAAATYTFSSVRANHTIEAKFSHDCPSKPFIDVDITQWYHEGIDYVLLAGLFNGTSATTFEPNNAMTRAMLVTVLHRLEGTPATTAGNPFADVASGNWYTNAVIWANAKGIVKGYDSDTFGANDFITREQLVTILYRYAQYKGYDVSIGEDTNILSYEDAFNISEYAIPAIQWACGAGVMQGDGAKLDPQGSATRAQVAAMLMRFIESVAK